MKVKKILADGTTKIYTYDQTKYRENKGLYNKEHGKYYLHGIPHGEYGKQKLMCECGCEVGRKSMKTHKTSKKHIKLLSELDTENKDSFTEKET